MYTCHIKDDTQEVILIYILTEKKIDMTVPVLKKYRMTSNGVENENQMAFFTELSNPPRPTERNVEPQTLPKMRVYVKLVFFKF